MDTERQSDSSRDRQRATEEETDLGKIEMIVKGCTVVSCFPPHICSLQKASHVPILSILLSTRHVRFRKFSQI